MRYHQDDADCARLSTRLMLQLLLANVLWRSLAAGTPLHDDADADKRTWRNMQGAWGKRDGEEANEAAAVAPPVPDADDVIFLTGHFVPLVISDGDNMLDWPSFQRWATQQQEQPADEEQPANEQNALAEKRSWRNANMAWGKRRQAQTWNKFRGAWGKRDAAWNRINNMWGKRNPTWQKMQGGWGKRANEQ